MNICFIGGGNMATALIGGLLKRDFLPAQISVVEPSADKRTGLQSQFEVRAVEKLADGMPDSEVIVLAVKPQQLREVALELARHLSGQLVISIAAGIRMPDLARWLGNYPKLVRTMPNTPALIGAGMTGLYATAEVTALERQIASDILGTVGHTLWVEREEQIDAITAVSGSGPAYIFYFIEAMQEAAVELGFTREEANRLTLQTALGAAQLAASSEEPVGVLLKRVTSAGGTTEAALRVKTERMVKQGIIAGMHAAEARGRELGELLGKD